MKNLARIAVLFALPIVSSCTPHVPMEHVMTSPPPARSPLADDASAGVSHEELARLLEEHWDWHMREVPIWATRLGDHRFDAELWHERPEDIATRRERLRDFRDRAKGIGRETLGAEDRTTVALFVEEIEARIGVEACDLDAWRASSFDNPASDLNRLPDMHVVRTAADAKNLVARYREIERVLAERSQNLRRGLTEKRVASREGVRRLVVQLDRQLERPAKEWSLVTAILSAEAKEKRKGLSASEEAAFVEEASRVVEERVAPAYRKFRDLLANEVMPAARPDDKEGVGALPNGDACYRSKIVEHLGSAREPEELHRMGLAEIDRINGEMQRLGKTLFGASELGEVLHRLRTDRSLYFANGEEIVRAAQSALDKGRAAMPRLFGVLPRTDCVVTLVPDDEAPFTTVAYYREPNYDGSKPGEYFINTYEPAIRPRFEMEALSFHEAIPGHHLQIAIAQEKGALPAFRKFGGSTAYVEGWALYTERLADEVGLYAGDLDRMGMLSYDAWRASRLVVDTGIHHLGWTRKKAEQYMLEHTALTPSNIENEVDRYIAWPGQALAYKFGQIEILRLRERAKEALGSKFDLRAFHDVLLASGAVTLPVLGQNVEAWIAARRAN
jgi:uncharacterized protein (DUF885 family)